MVIIDKIKDFLYLGDEPPDSVSMFSPEVLREYDIRGIVGKTLFTENAYDIGRAFGTVIIREKLKRLCVGCDCRVSSDEMAKNLIKGLVDSGAEVISLGVCHTPLMYYTVHKLHLDAGVMVTGSHNPPEYNGFKFMLGLDPFYGSNIKNLGKMVVEKDFVDGVGREIVMNNILQKYIMDILSDFNFHDDIKIAWDIGNGATSNAIKAITTFLPGKHHVLFEEMNGKFPNRPPDPIVADNMKYLSKFVSYNEFDIGFGFDSDGDRVCIVNGAGDMLHSDQVLSVLAKDFLRKNPGAQVIADVTASSEVFNTIGSCGGIGIMERVGHSFIKERMKATGAMIAGETSGHFFFKDRWFGFDDGIYAALRCIELLCNDKSTFHNIPHGFVTPGIRIDFDENKKFEVVKAVKEKAKQQNTIVTEIDGIRVNSDIGWWILRPSNTQSALSLRIEVYAKENMSKMKHEVASYLKEYIPDIADILSNIT